MKISGKVVLAFSAVPLVFSLTARTQNSTVVTVGGGAIVPKLRTRPVLKRAMLKLPRVTGYMLS